MYTCKGMAFFIFTDGHDIGNENFGRNLLDGLDPPPPHAPNSNFQFASDFLDTSVE